MNEGIGAADEECSEKARMQGARLRTLLECLLHSRRMKTKLKHSTNKGPPVAAAL